MKRVLSLLITLVLCVSVFASCYGVPEGDSNHVHTFEETWTSDASGHWYAATCDCADFTEPKFNHTDKNNDGACDVCEYMMACADGHTYSEDWTVDCTNHWHAADCGHIVAGADVAAHADTDEDGKCDECGYVITDIHKHYYASEWTYDETNHWHAALCEHSVEVADVEAHVVDATGYCTVCGAKVKDVDAQSIEAMLNAAIANNGKVVDGSVLAGQLVYSGSGDNMYISSSLFNDVYFVLGNGSSYVYRKTLDENGSFVGAVENWYELIGEEEVFGVERQHADYVFSPVTGAMNHLNGYTYNPGSILPSIDDDTSTIANTLAAIYGIKKAGTHVSNASENYDAETGVYTFSFSYYKVDASTQSDGSTHYQVEVYGVAAEFTFDDNFVIDSCELAVSVYRNVEQDMDLDYDPTSDTYALRAEANPSVYVYEVSQRSGERTFTNPYPKASLIPTDFNFYTANVEDDVDASGIAYKKVTVLDEVGESVTVKEGSFLYLALRDIRPSTAFTSFIERSDLDISFVNKTTGDSGVLYTESEFNPSYSSAGGYLAIFVKDAGTYTLTVKYRDVVKSFDVVVEAEQGSGIVAGENEIVVKTTETYCSDFCEADTYTFTATKGEGKYTFTIPAGLGVWSKSAYDAFSAPEVDFYANTSGATFSVELEANAEFVFHVSAINKAEWVISYAYEACEVEGGSQGGGEEQGGAPASDISGTYYSGDAVLVINTDGTMTFTVGGRTSNYTYAINGATVTYTLNGNDPYDETNNMAMYFGYLTFDSEGKPATFVNNGNTYTLSTTAPTPDPEPEPDPDEAVLVLGTNTVTITEAEAAEGGKMYTFTTVVAGSYTFASNDVGVRIFDGTDVVGMGVVTLEAGKTYNAFVLAMEEGTYTVNVTVAEEGGEPDGSEGDPYVWDALPESVTFVSDTINKVYYLYTAAANGTITFAWATADSWGDWFLMDGDNTTATNGGSSMVTTMVINVVAGETYRIGLGTFNDPGEVTITVAFAEGGEGGEGEEEEITIKQNIYDGEENSVSVSADDLTAGKFYVSFMALNSGEYSFASSYLLVKSVTTEDGTVIEKNESYRYVLSEYTTYVIELDTKYISSAGEYVITPAYNYPEGHQNNPFDITIGETVTAQYPGGYNAVWYSFNASENGVVTVSSSNPNATLMITAAFGYELQGTGSVSLYVMAGRQYFIGVADFDTFDENYSNPACDIEFSTSFAAGEIETDGTPNVPHEIVIGDNTAKVESYGVTYFVYHATANGVLTLTTADANCGWKIAKSIEGLAMAMTSSTELTINVEWGDFIYVYVETVDGSAADIAFAASFDEAPSAAWYEDELVIDGTAANEIVIEDNTWVQLSLFGNGEFILTWDNADAIVELATWGQDPTALVNGATVMGSMYGVDLKVYLPDYAAGTVKLTITPVVAAGAELVIGDNTVSVTDTYNGTQATFVAPEDGSYTFTVGDNGVVVYDYTNYLKGEVITIELAANEEVAFVVLTENYEAGDVAIAVVKREAGAAPEAVDGEYRYVDPADWKHRWQIMLNADGTGTLKEQNYNPDNFSWSATVESTLTYTYENGVVTIDFAEGAQAVDGAYTVTTDGIAAVARNGANVDFALYV